MKLFKSLLVAPATLGLLAPMSATANEVTISDFTPEEQIAITNSRVDGLEARLNNIEAGSFSETTTASFSADFAIGAVDGKDIQNNSSTVSYNKGTDGDEDLQAIYGFQIDLSTSFSGSDSLDISIDAGNAVVDTTSGSATEGQQTGPLAEFDLNGGGDTLTVDGVSYTFPIGDKTTVIVGDNTDGSALFNIACVYGGPSNTLDDCGAAKAGITGGGVAIGASYDIGGGFTAAAGAQFTETGIGTKENSDQVALNFAYTADTYGASVTYAAYEQASGSTHTDSYTAVNAYWTPEGFPSISAGYEVGVLQNANKYTDETIQYFVGVETEVGPGTFGAALGTQGSVTEEYVSGGTSKFEEEMMYEAYYSYEVNDGMTITPLIYIQEDKETQRPDRTGIMVKTSFSF